MAWFALAGAAAQAFSNWFSNQMSMKNQYELMDKQHAQNKELARMQQNYLLQNAKDASTIERVSREQAGFNLNGDGGFSPLAGMSSPSTGSPSAPQMAPVDIASMLGIDSQLSLQNAQKRKVEADAKKQELENLGTEEENRWYMWSFDPEFDKLEYKKDIEKGIDGYVLPDVNHVVPKATTRKGIEAKELAKVRIQSEFAKLESLQSQEELVSMVADGQIKNNEVVKALIEMPSAQYDEVMKRIAEMASHMSLMEAQAGLAISQKELNNLEKEFSPKAIMEKILNHPLDPATWFTTIISLAIKKAFGR